MSKEYIRPAKTYTEKLSTDEIKKRLEDYVEVDDISKVPINTHLRYFQTDKHGNKKFRMGGYLLRNAGLPDYIMLTNGKLTWSVQVKEAVFFKKMSIMEFKKEYVELLNVLNKENKKLKEENEHLKKKLKTLTR